MPVTPHTGTIVDEKPLRIISIWAKWMAYEADDELTMSLSLIYLPRNGSWGLSRNLEKRIGDFRFLFVEVSGDDTYNAYSIGKALVGRGETGILAIGTVSLLTFAESDLIVLVG